MPTLAEAGLKGVDVDMWYGFFAPKGTPADIVDRLNSEIVAILDTPEAKAAFEAQGLIPATSTPAHSARSWRATAPAGPMSWPSAGSSRSERERRPTS